jgi:NAD(P)-dependent dehydrogenase (short-subunit alcohol dehydrogenase family)
MKVLITGGSKGLGRYLTEQFGADSIGRSEGYDITKPEDQKRIAKLSLGYDVFINNAFDGPPAEDWANFGQVNVYLAVYEAWRNADKSGHIFNIGSIGAKVIPAPEPRYKTYCVAKAALEQASKQGTQGFKQGKAKFKTTLITMDKLNTDEHPHWKPEWWDAFWPRLDKWEGTGIELEDIYNYIKFCLTLNGNNCIEETVFYCNYYIKG